MFNIIECVNHPGFETICQADWADKCRLAREYCPVVCNSCPGMCKFIIVYLNILMIESSSIILIRDQIRFVEKFWTLGYPLQC